MIILEFFRIDGLLLLEFFVGRDRGDKRNEFFFGGFLETIMRMSSCFIDKRKKLFC